MEYYTKMERRHLRGVSGAVLDALAGGLQLDQAERDHLSNLARAAGPMPRTGRRPAAQRVRPTVQRIIDAMTGAPVNELGRMDAVIHNAGVYTGRHVMPVNIVAPYLLTALIDRPQRLVYVSSGDQRRGRARLTGIDWSGRTTGSYPDSKLFVTTLAAALARLWPDVLTNAVDPGWVPTRMGGPGAPDDLRLGHLTQEWLATSDDPDARTSGGYWNHQRRLEAHAAVHDRGFQDQLLDGLAGFTGTRLT